MSGLASQAGAQADRIMIEGHVAINETGVLAITGLQRVSNGVTSLWREARRAKTPNRGRTQNPGNQNSSPSSRGVKPIPGSGQRGPGEGVQNP
jgi:hypothetical protein